MQDSSRPNESQLYEDSLEDFGSRTFFAIYLIPPFRVREPFIGHSGGHVNDSAQPMTKPPVALKAHFFPGARIIKRDISCRLEGIGCAKINT